MNYYLYVADKKLGKEILGQRVEVTDEPDFGYKLHIAKTSCGWLPLFEKSESVSCVKDIEKIVKDNPSVVIILNEENAPLSWDEFKEKVLEHEGGTTEKRVLVPNK